MAFAAFHAEAGVQDFGDAEVALHLGKQSGLQGFAFRGRHRAREQHGAQVERLRVEAPLLEQPGQVAGIGGVVMSAVGR